MAGIQRRAIFFCDLSPAQRKEAAAWSKSYGAGHRKAAASRLALLGPKPTLRWSTESNFELTEPADELTEDLLALASHLYQADRVLKRSEEGAMGWARELEFHLAVRNEDLWKRQASELSTAINLLTKDDVRFRFYPLARRWARPPLPLPVAPLALPEEISVFSTHFVSAFGLASANQDGGVIASVRYGRDSPKEDQYRLSETITGLTGKFFYAGFRLETHLESKERTQRSLGFLHLALAAALARSTGLKKIQLFGDGISSYHLRKFQLCGPGYGVREMRPDFLSNVLEIFQALDILKADTRVHNLFQFYTAREVLEAWPQQDKRRELLQSTDSCLEKSVATRLRSDWKGAVPHCGFCFPCKLRRLAALAAGLESRNDYSAYAFDPMRLDLPDSALKSLGENSRKRVRTFHDGIRDFRRYLEAFRDDGAPADPFVERVQQEIEDKIGNLQSPRLALPDEKAGPGGAATATQVGRKIREVHRRFADQVLRYFP